MPWPEAGEGVGLLRTNMAGHRVVEASVVGIEPGGRFRPHRPMAEEALLILAGAGRDPPAGRRRPRGHP